MKPLYGVVSISLDAIKWHLEDTKSRYSSRDEIIHHHL